MKCSGKRQPEPADRQNIEAKPCPNTDRPSLNRQLISFTNSLSICIGLSICIVFYDEWRRVHTYTSGTSGQDDHVVRTFSYDDPRSLVTDLREDTRDGYTIVHRDYDAQTRVTSETVSMDGSVIRHLTNGYDAAGRRSSLEKGTSIADLGNGAGGSFAFAWQADGALKSVTADGKVFEYSYADNGLITGRSNPWRSYVVNQRDNRGRLTQTTTSVVGLPGALLQETLTWLDDNRQSSYVASRAALLGGPAAQTDARYYGYDVERRRLVSESYTPVTGVAQNLSFQYDFGFAGLGIRTSATQGSSPTADFRSYVASGDTGATSKFARVLRQTSNEKVHDITATGNAFGAASVTASIEKVGSLPNVSHPGWQHPVGNWSVPLRLWPGDHSLEATAHHPGGTFNTSATSNFSLARLEEQVSNTYDEEGNVIQRSWSLSGRTQVLTWDGQGRLLAVTDRDTDQHGINWKARYDGLGRRLRTVTQTVRFGGVVGDAVQEDSWYDPLHEFLEVAVETRIGGADGKRTWKVHGPDANGSYGGLQGIGGFEATVDEAAGAWTAVVDDYYGHVVATVDGGTSTTVSWQVTRCASYGPQPGSPVVTLAHGVSVAHSTNWRGERMDVTGFYYLGARYYDPVDGRFVSPDPMGHGASLGLHDYAGSDPVNFVDPNGRLQTRQLQYERAFDLPELEINGQFSFSSASGGQASTAGSSAHLNNWSSLRQPESSLPDLPSPAAMQILAAVREEERQNDPTWMALEATFWLVAIAEPGPGGESFMAARTLARAESVAATAARSADDLVVLYHGTTSNMASKITTRGFRTADTFFAEETATSRYFASEAAARTGARSLTSIQFTMPRTVAQDLGLLERRIIGADRNLPTPDIDFGTGVERILSSGRVAEFNAMLENGVIVFRRLRH
ncbi:RHS repeat-associated core domain-containing protein [Verrucomicrobium sp. BvORR034]|uniref:RHS repeat-associated core domain-containing protein n=1 Tax=Verrucomicrobium sp. BvORR034 TaxID=1396418 RepID=UPI000A74DC1E|nr:RHS repeat-associated core domain-containing protein [Verrucomicrobium sp. BvORR034]